MKLFYCINLMKKTPRVMEFAEDELQDVASDLGKKVSELSNFDAKIFSSEEKAHAWLEKYLAVGATLKNLEKKTPDIKASILYKRRYMIQTILGEKNHTFRSSENTVEQMKKVKIGEKFRLYDQTKFIVVKLTGRKNIKGEVRYDFELA